MSKFKETVAIVIKLQRAYRKVKFRRMIKRALMNQAWDKFIDKNKKIAQKNEQSLKK